MGALFSKLGFRAHSLWTPNGSGGVVGWLNTKAKRDDYTEPGKALDPSKEMRISQIFYAVMPSPLDGTVCNMLRAIPGSVVRLNPGPNRRRPH